MIQIIIAEDQGMMLGALSALFNMEEDFEVVGKAKNGEEAVSLVKELAPDICVMDVEMPIKTGLDAAEELKGNPCKVIILTTFAQVGYFERARNAGVRGFLLKDNPIEELADAIRIVMDGRRAYAPELVDTTYNENIIENPLRSRESEVLHLVSEEKTTKKIAGELYLPHGTLRSYISMILKKVDVSNRIEAISRFKEKGWFK